MERERERGERWPHSPINPLPFYLSKRERDELSYHDFYHMLTPPELFQIDQRESYLNSRYTATAMCFIYVIVSIPSCFTVGAPDT